MDERDKSDKLWELLTTLHENPPKADHGKTVSRSNKYATIFFCAQKALTFYSLHLLLKLLSI